MAKGLIQDYISGNTRAKNHYTNLLRVKPV